MMPRRLTEAEFKATFSDQMRDITGREEGVHPDGVLDLAPYLAATDVAPLQLLPDQSPAAVYHSPDRGFDHVLYRCDRSNTYLVVVVTESGGKVHGHYVLDLGLEYALPT